MYITLGKQSPYFSLYIGFTCIIYYNIQIKSKQMNKKIYEETNNTDLYNQIEYFIDNYETIKHDMFKLYKTLYETNNLTLANTFLLCSRNLFPRDIRNIIFHKILFFFRPRSGLNYSRAPRRLQADQVGHVLFDSMIQFLYLLYSQIFFAIQIFAHSLNNKKSAI